MRGLATSSVKKLLQQIEIANRRHQLFKKNDVLVVGVSAGPDSMALLWLIDKLKIKYAFKINVAHLNHGLLKKAGNEYLKLVKKTSQALKIPFYSKTIDLKTLAKKNKRSIEEMGRIERYSFFEDIAAKTRADKIVTAHTLDDQAETMLLRLIRGSGLKGLIGIPY
ncbi:MAG: tRNA lysidine(34) synthetase TilS [Candidatus Omnitrophica bacterium CG07_land_8_20_14_0_80_50_8]|nr:MAG: tRNA lysidine(34) synthetase TilS [Candidatus Omnitrophica bacterium CG07_land_8_20_14_0_80_50_8]